MVRNTHNGSVAAKGPILDPLFDEEGDAEEMLETLPENPSEAFALVQAGLDELVAPSSVLQTVTGQKIVAANPAGLRSITDIIRDLSRELPPQWLYLLDKGVGKKLTAYSWFRVNQAFDKYAVGWCSEITNIYEAQGHILTAMRISIPCLEGLVYREDIGGSYENIDVVKRSKGFDPALKAKQQALKRAAAQFGFGLYLYSVRKE